MTRRRPKRRVPAPVHVDWTAWFAEMFELIPAGWTPPKRVRLSGSAAHFTVTARFVDPLGNPATARVRIRRDDAGEYWVEDQTLAMRLGFPARAA